MSQTLTIPPDALARIRMLEAALKSIEVANHDLDEMLRSVDEDHTIEIAPTDTLASESFVGFQNTPVQLEEITV